MIFSCLFPFSLLDLEITVPIRHSHNTLGKPECGIYEYTPRKNVFPPKKEIKRGDWKTESTSSTTSKQTLIVTPQGQDFCCWIPVLMLPPWTLHTNCSQSCKSNSSFIKGFGHTCVCISLGGKPESWAKGFPWAFPRKVYPPSPALKSRWQLLFVEKKYDPLLWLPAGSVLFWPEGCSRIAGWEPACCYLSFPQLL